MNERAYLLERCLRLEAQLAERGGVAEVARPAYAWPYRIHRRVTEAEVAQMRALRREGLSVCEIAGRLHRLECTIREHMRR